MDKWESHPVFAKFHVCAGFPILQESEEKQLQLVEKMKQAIDQIDHDTILTILTEGDGWRATESVTWMIAYAQLDGHLETIGQRMLNIRAEYTMMSCFAFARLPSKIGQTYLTQFLDKYFQKYENYFLMINIPFDLILVTLKRLDDVFQTNYFDKFYPNMYKEFTENFVASQYSFTQENLPWNLKIARTNLAWFKTPES
jgi:hypothetical protein